jgi:hypothetical protein
LGKKQTNQWAEKKINGQKNNPWAEKQTSGQKKASGQKKQTSWPMKNQWVEKTIWIKSCTYTSLVCFAKTIRVEHFEQQNLYCWVDTS